MNDRLTYTVAEASALLGISRNSGYEAARRGELPTIRIGRRLLIPRSRLEELLGVVPQSKEGMGADG